jgi:AraC family transcriptional regulator
MSIDAVCEGLNFIEKNLKEPIAVADMADAVHLSLFYFCRVFNNFVYQTPYDYLIKRRLSKSAYDLVETSRRITDIALEYQFGNLETYSRAFKRMIGQQPSQWRRNKKIDRRRLMPELTPSHIRFFHQTRPLLPTSEHQSVIHVAGLMAWIQDECTEIPILWQRFSHELIGIENQVKPARFYGIAHDADANQEGYFYIASVQVNSPLCFHPLAVVKSLPDMTYARFIHRGRLEDLLYTRDFIHHIWVPKTDRLLGLEVELHDFGSDMRVVTKGGQWTISVPLSPVG